MSNEYYRLHIIVTGAFVLLADVWWLSCLWLIGAVTLLWGMRHDPVR